jgi:hypothetical protein
MNQLSRVIRRAACAVGLHKHITHDKWTPSIAAKIVTDFERKQTCARCGVVLRNIHWHWNGQEMVDVTQKGTT